MQCKRKRDFGVVGGLSCKFLVRSISQAGDAALADIAEKKVVVEGFRKIVGVVSRDMVRVFPRPMRRKATGIPSSAGRRRRDMWTPSSVSEALSSVHSEILAIP